MYGSLKNTTDAMMVIPSFLVEVPAGESLNLLTSRHLRRTQGSASIKALLLSGDLELYDTVPALVSPTGYRLWIDDQLGIRPRFEAYNSEDSNTFTTSAAEAQPLDTTSVESSNFTLSPAGTHVDINFNGAADIQAEVSVVGTSGSGESGIDSWLELNGVFIPGTLRSTVLHEGEGNSISMGRSSLAVEDEDELAVVTQRTSGSLSWCYPASGCRLRLRRVE